jgi:hypothetical protein
MVAKNVLVIKINFILTNNDQLMSRVNVLKICKKEGMGHLNFALFKETYHLNPLCVISSKDTKIKKKIVIFFHL